MDAAYQRRLELNIVKYSWIRIFNKRVYLPLIAVYLVNIGLVTVRELGIIAIVTTVVQGLLQVPTGYFADKFGNRKAIVIGAWITVFSPLFYVFMPSFVGGLVAALLFHSGWAFQAGAMEALIHDTLMKLGRDHEYSKVMGRTQTQGLIGNMVLIALVPLTYSIDPRLPFILGFLSLIGLLLLSISLVETGSFQKEHKVRNPIEAAAKVITLENIALFAFAGFLGGVAARTVEYRELFFQDIGINVSLFGIILSIASLLGALFGWYVYMLDKLRALSFYLLDAVIMAGCIVLIGFTSNPVFVISGFTLFTAYTRVRSIIFQSKLLQDLQHVYKATLLSALSLCVMLGDVLIITFLTQLVRHQGYQHGYFIYGLGVFGISLALWLVMFFVARYRVKPPQSNPLTSGSEGCV